RPEAFGEEPLVVRDQYAHDTRLLRSQGHRPTIGNGVAFLKSCHAQEGGDRFAQAPPSRPVLSLRGGARATFELTGWEPPEGTEEGVTALSRRAEPLADASSVPRRADR